MTEPDQPGNDGLRINAVAELSGLSEHTIRAWERRYGVPDPGRSAGKQRLYSREDVAALRRMHELSRQGVSLAAAARAVRSEQEAGSLHGEDQPGLPAASTFAGALLRFDESSANDLWSEALGAASFTAVLEQMVIPALRDIGDRWHAGEASVAQEHFASGFIRARLDALARHHTPPSSAPAVLLACLPDDWHELGLLMLNVLLRYRGLRTVYLGQSVPVDDILRAMNGLQPAVVVVHGSGDEARDALVALVTGAAARTSGSPIVYGGPPFGAGDAPVQGATYGGDSVTGAVSLVERMARV